MHYNASAPSLLPGDSDSSSTLRSNVGIESAIHHALQKDGKVPIHADQHRFTEHRGSKQAAMDLDRSLSTDLLEQNESTCTVPAVLGKNGDRLSSFRPEDEQSERAKKLQNSEIIKIHDEVPSPKKTKKRQPARVKARQSSNQMETSLVLPKLQIGALENSDSDFQSYSFLPQRSHPRFASLARADLLG